MEDEDTNRIQAPYGTADLDQQLIDEHVTELLADYDYPGLPEDFSNGPTLYDPVIILRPENLRISLTARLDSYCKLEVGDGMVVGHHVHVASFAHLGIGGGVTILEDGTSFASGSKVMSGSNVPARGRSCSAVAPGNRVARYITRIKRNAVLFAGAQVLPGVTVGENAVIAAGAIVVCDVPSFEVWGGIPARKIGVDLVTSELIDKVIEEDERTRLG
jgi:acetyltransferase-like isoleucine patch superfamily enzyme